MYVLEILIDIIYHCQIQENSKFVPIQYRFPYKLFYFLEYALSLGLTAGSVHACLLSCAGVIYSFGKFEYNGHGFPSDTLDALPLCSSKFGGEKIVQVATATAGFHTLALTESGEVYSFGHNRVGQVGHPDLEVEEAGENDFNSSSETDDSNPPIPVRYAAVSMAGNTTKNDGIRMRRNMDGSLYLPVPRRINYLPKDERIVQVLLLFLLIAFRKYGFILLIFYLLTPICFSVVI